MKLQRIGGYAAIASVCMFILLGAFSSMRLGDLTDPVKALAACVAAPYDFYVVNLLTIVCYILWLILTYALHERMQANAPHLTRMALIAASAGTAAAIANATISTKVTEMIVQTKDVSAFRAMQAFYSGLDFMAGHAYAWVCLLIGFAVLKTRAFSRIPGWLFLLAGIRWILVTSFPLPMGFIFLVLVNYLFCFVSIVWFGIAMLRQQRLQPASGKMAESS